MWENPNFPVSSHLSAPFIRRPIFACTPVVAVQSCLPGADVAVFDDTNDQLLGKGTCSDEGDVIVNVGVLGIGDTIYARQAANGSTSGRSQTVAIEDYGQNAVPTPRLKNDTMWECGEIAPTEGTLPGMRVELFKNGTKVAGSWATNAWGRNGYWPVPHTSTPQGSDGSTMKVRQIYCPKNSSRNASNLSAGEKVQSEPNPIPPLSLVRGYENTRLVRTKNSTFGAELKVFANGSPSPFTDYPAPWPNMRNWFAHIISASDSFTATQQLCPGQVSTPVTGNTVPAGKVKGLLDKIEIVEPVCPNTEAIRVRTSLPAGRIAISKNSSFLFQGPAGNGMTTLGIPPSVTLAQGDTVKANQFVEGGQIGNDAQTTVGGNPSFEVLGAQSLTSQNTGNQVSGFVREDSRGPRFVLQECCGQKSPPTVNVKIIQESSDQSYPELVTLRRQSNGYYTGRWDWFVPGVQAPDGVWPPAANYTYSARVTLPCSGVTKTKQFGVLTGEADETDATAPSVAKLTVTGDDGNSEGVSVDEGVAKSIEVAAGASAEITAAAADRQGLQELSITPTAGIDAPTANTAVETVPIPPKLSLNTDADALAPYEDITIQAEATNFAQTTKATPQLKIVGRHDTPVIDAISPDGAYSDQTITITGKHLFAATTQTTVHFNQVDGPQQADVTVSNASADELADIAIPAAFAGMFGAVEVTVETTHASTSTSKQSDPMTFDLLDRANTFQSFDGNDFKNLNLTCSSSEPGTISDVTISTGTNGACADPSALVATVTYNNGDSYGPICYKTLATGNGNQDLGGVVLFDTSCRTLAVLSWDDDSPDQNPPPFNLRWYFFDETGDAPYSSPSKDVDLAYLDDSEIAQFVPSKFKVFATTDGSVVLSASPVAYPNGPTGTPFPIVEHIRDMRDTSNEASSPSYGYCMPGTVCPMTPSIGVHDVSLSVDGSNIVDLQLDNF